MGPAKRTCQSFDSVPFTSAFRTYLLILICIFGAQKSLAQDASHPNLPLLTKQVTTGNEHTCTLTQDDRLYCWGRNEEWQLGTAMPEYQHRPAPIPLDFGQESKVRHVSAGFNFTCAVLMDGAVACWGTGMEGQLGNGQRLHKAIPEKIALGPGRTAREVAVGYRHACAILTDGGISCWGRNQEGQLGYAATPDEELRPSKPLAFGASKRAKQLALGDAHTCALFEDGSVSCWGNGEFGQLGYGEPEVKKLLPVGTIDFGTTEKVRQITAGSNHSCAVFEHGSAKCWGSARDSRLGLKEGFIPGPFLAKPPAEPIDFRAPLKVLEMAAGDRHSCARFEDKTIRCWGVGPEGQLGSGYRFAARPPIASLELPLGALSLSVSANHGCARLEDQTVRCWGSNVAGQIGIGTASHMRQAQAETISFGPHRKVLDISLGIGHSCAILDDRSVRCWGENRDGALGYGDQMEIEVPLNEAVAIGGKALQLAAGANFTCALVEGGRVTCWGDNYYGQLGQSLKGESTKNGNITKLTKPSPFLPSLRDARKIFAGPDHACALLRDNSLRCWGRAVGADLGKSASDFVRTPSQPLRFPKSLYPKDLALGDDHGCALLHNGSISCFGDNTWGQRGIDTSKKITTLPLVPLNPSSPIIAVAAGSRHSCALLQEGKVTCWGGGTWGQLGDNMRKDYQRAGESWSILHKNRSAVAIATRGSHTCVLLQGGDVQCWGIGNSGQLGYGQRKNLGRSLFPVDLKSPHKAIKIATGPANTCVILSDQSLKCWGAGALGYPGLKADRPAKEPIRFGL